MVQRHVLALILMTVLAGCASIKAVEPGTPAKVGRLTIDPQVKWARFALPGTSGTLWTIDGLGLNELHFFSDIKPGSPLLKVSGQQKDSIPKYEDSMLPNDVMELLASTIGRMGYRQVRTSGLAPAQVDGAESYTFELAFTTQDGLEMKSRALVVKKDSKLDILLFLAPGEYYYPQYAPVVERALASVKLAAGK